MPLAPNVSNPHDKPLPDAIRGVADVLGIQFTELSPDRVTATMAVTPDHHQPFGILHGGVSVVLAESVASFGGYLAAPAGHAAVGVEINANHVRSVRDGTLTAVGVPKHTGRTTHVWSVELTDAQDRLVCVSRCTLAIVEQDA
jgi:uncharacterized protein (TIGR00369 family)